MQSKLIVRSRMSNKDIIESILAYLKENKGKRLKLTDLMERIRLKPDITIEILGRLEREYGLKISFY